MNADPQIGGYFDQYSDLACAVLDDQRPNTHMDMEMSNAEMHDDICENLDWEAVDLLVSYDFESIYSTGSKTQVLSYFYIAHLRLDLFNSASIEEIGDREFNKAARAFCEYWYMKLRDKYDAMESDEPVRHTWLN